MAGAFDRPDASAARVASRKSERLRVAATVRSNRPLRHNRPGGRGQHRQHMLVQVRVDADDVVQLICKHPD